jgi:hypothetical protein
LTKERSGVTAEDVEEGELGPLVRLGEDSTEVAVVRVEEGELIWSEDREG